jgi:hypothetical protein
MCCVIIVAGTDHYQKGGNSTDLFTLIMLLFQPLCNHSQNIFDRLHSSGSLVNGMRPCSINSQTEYGNH